MTTNVLAAAAPESTANRLLWKWAMVGSGVAIIGLSTIVGHNIWLRLQTASLPTAAAATQSASVPAIQPVPVISRAESLLQSFAPHFPGLPGLVITDLRTGQSTSMNEHQVFISASLYKLFVAYSVYRQIDTGALSLTTPVGNTTVAGCLDRMITVSDNACGVTLGNLVQWESQNTNLQAAGFKDTKLARSSDERTSAADVANLFQQLYSGKLVSPSSNEHFLSLLKRQQIANRLPARLPAGTIIAHKTGDLDGLVHDAGIVYTPGGDYSLTVLSGPWPSPADAPATIADLSAQTYKLFNP